MISITIPGREKLQLAHAVFDVNGTIAVDDVLIDAIDFALHPKRLIATLRA